jgi:hypothetical protein
VDLVAAIGDRTDNRVVFPSSLFFADLEKKKNETNILTRSHRIHITAASQLSCPASTAGGHHSPDRRLYSFLSDEIPWSGALDRGWKGLPRAGTFSH